MVDSLARFIGVQATSKVKRMELEKLSTRQNQTTSPLDNNAEQEQIMLEPRNQRDERNEQHLKEIRIRNSVEKSLMLL